MKKIVASLAVLAIMATGCGAGGGAAKDSKTIKKKIIRLFYECIIYILR